MSRLLFALVDAMASLGVSRLRRLRASWRSQTEWGKHVRRMGHREMQESIRWLGWWRSLWGVL